VNRSDKEDYRSFVVARMDRLQRAAYLLCHNWHTADDLVSITLGKLYRNWSRARGADNLDAYVQKIMLRSWLDELRRPWRRERLTDDLPETAVAHEPDVIERANLVQMLAALTPRRRAVIVLRFYFDLSVDETAEMLGCSTATVSKLSTRALAALRARTAEPHLENEGVTP
jgi:RNA polymerase sigma-70 factor (sigma-E family)